jgi:hypothetical protein
MKRCAKLKFKLNFSIQATTAGKGLPLPATSRFSSVIGNGGGGVGGGFGASVFGAAPYGAGAIAAGIT